jgi:hypothetical protein
MHGGIGIALAGLIVAVITLIFQVLGDLREN